jgi:integrase
VSAVRNPRVLSHREAARLLQAARAHSAWAGLVVGVALVTGWRIPEVTRRLRRLTPKGVTR